MVDHETFSQLLNLDECLSLHKDARKLLTHTTSRAEVSVVGKISGVECKGLIDLVNPKINLIADIKTTRRITKATYERDAREHGTPFQLAFYERLYLDATGERPRHAIITYETSPPHEFSLYYPDADWIDIGHEQVDRALDLYKQYQEDDFWPTKQNGKGEVLSAPSWLKRKRQ